MCFERNLSGIDVMLRIANYQSPLKHEWGDWWCVCNFSLRMGENAKIINYHLEQDELFLPEEVDALVDAFTNLLDGNLTEPQEKPMIEPDFVFQLYPVKDLRTDPTYTYVAPEYELQDIYVEWRIYFWHEGLTDNFLTVTLYRDDITALRDYLESVRRQDTSVSKS